MGEGGGGGGGGGGGVVGTYEGANKADKISRPWFHVVSENVGNQEQVGR